jgi:ABC-type transport system involved in cytochrome c biogenesis permease subunit
VNVVEFLLYAAAAVLYGVHFLRRSPAVGQAATACLVAGVVAHTFVLGMHTMRVGYVPLVGHGGAISAFVWLLALTYLYVELTTSERAMGAFIVPFVALVSIVPLTSPAPVERPAVLDNPLFGVHIASLLFAYAAFALACVVGVTYVLLCRELKRKQPGMFFARLPSLAALDQMNRRAVSIGMLFMTAGVIAGIVWAAQARGYAPGDPRVQAMSLTDPKILIALCSWGIYAFQIFARVKMGWGGRRTAWLSALGFACVLINLLPVSYLIDTSHAFD